MNCSGNETYWNFLIENAKLREKYFKNYKYYGKILKKKAKELLRDEKLRVLIFGSVVENMHTMASDIDVLIISKNVPENLEERAKILLALREKVGILSPFQIHLISPKIYEGWYKKFIKKFLEI